MKAYFIGGCEDQTKRIVTEPPQHIVKAIVYHPVSIRRPSPFPPGEITHVRYHSYHLIEMRMPDGEKIALYLYDAGIEK